MRLTDSLTDDVAVQLSSLVKAKIIGFQDDASKPFHERLLGKKWTHAHAFIHSIMTTLGASMFEQIAVSIAKDNPAVVDVERSFDVGSSISTDASAAIDDIINELNLSPDRPSDWTNENQRIKSLANRAPFKELKPLKVDLRVVLNTGMTFLIELKTARPNKAGFRDYKRTLLTWFAVHRLSYPQKEVHSILAFPYDPYQKNIERSWTMQNLLDIKHELLVGPNFWNFLAGRDIFDELLTAFEVAGRELEPYLTKFLNSIDKERIPIRAVD